MFLMANWASALAASGQKVGSFMVMLEIRFRTWVEQIHHQPQKDLVQNQLFTCLFFTFHLNLTKSTKIMWIEKKVLM